MGKNIGIAIGAAIVGALLLYLYDTIILRPILPAQPPAPCNQGTCAIGISVWGECGNPNNIQPAPDPAPIARQNHNPIIEWNLSAGGPYTFAANGIDFHGNSQFTDCHAPGPFKFQCRDTNSDSNYHKYAINLMHDSTACASKDPGIINGQ